MREEEELEQQKADERAKIEAAEFEEKRKLEEEELERKRRLQEEETHIKKLTETASLIKQFTNDIPVSLSRISELLKTPEQEVERLLKELLSYQENLGEYLELEQIFIKRSKINSNMNEVIESTKSNPFTAIHVCSVCNTAQPVLTRICVNCDKAFPYCSICGRGFGEEDELSSCPHCENSFHSVHVFAYIQSKGSCPICKEKLNQKLLRPN